VESARPGSRAIPGSARPAGACWPPPPGSGRTAGPSPPAGAGHRCSSACAPGAGCRACTARGWRPARPAAASSRRPGSGRCWSPPAAGRPLSCSHPPSRDSQSLDCSTGPASVTARSAFFPHISTEEIAKQAKTWPPVVTVASSPSRITRRPIQRLRDYQQVGHRRSVRGWRARAEPKL